MLFICLHHLCRSRVTCGVIGVNLIILIKFTPIMTSLGVTHTLWNIAGSPLQTSDDFWGYSASISLYYPYVGLWIKARISLVLFTTNRLHRVAGLSILSIMNSPKNTQYFNRFCLGIGTTHYS
jgi:ABC-2 type transport system permease protein